MGTSHKRRVTVVIKRDGRKVPFDYEKVVQAIFKAFRSAGEDDLPLAQKMASKVVEEINRKFAGKTPTVEDVQDAVEKVLIKEGLNKTAKIFILYREQRRALREYIVAILGKAIKTNLSLNALTLLRERYLLKNHYGELIEMPDQMFWRVATAVAKADVRYGGKAAVKKATNRFFLAMHDQDFLPSSPILMHAGTDLGQLSSCFVIPIEDDLDSIFDALRTASRIHQSGGGTGFTFSKLRPKGDIIQSTKGISSGPVSFIRIFDRESEVMKQGSKHRGSNMGILRVDHPDILEFITAKDQGGELQNFNLSVGVTREFMDALAANKEYALINPRNEKPVKEIPARDVFELMTFQAWKNGDPGILFLDRINKANPTPALGDLESTSPCGEMPMLPNEAGHLGSINLANMVVRGTIDEKRLWEITQTAVHFLDNALDVTRYPSKIIAEATKANRKIGIGVMGFADMLYQLTIPYNSNAAVEAAEQVMKVIRDAAIEESARLAGERGAFPNFRKSVLTRKGRLRNATRTTIAPTGSISIIADTSAGIEPNLALCYTRKVLGDREFFQINRHFEMALRDAGLYNEALLQKLKNKSSIQDVEEIPEKLRKVFALAFDVEPEWHVKIQAAFQKHTDNAISKTVNFPANATVKDVQEVFKLAYKLGCKGITIYRDQSKQGQIFNLQS